MSRYDDTMSIAKGLNSLVIMRVAATPLIAIYVNGRFAMSSEKESITEIAPFIAGLKIDIILEYFVDYISVEETFPLFMSDFRTKDIIESRIIPTPLTVN